MAIMLITHDLGVVAEMADDVAVMYLGQVVETADIDAIFHDPKHPYTQALLRSIPKLGREAAAAAEFHRGHGARPLHPAERLLLPSALHGLHGRLCDRETPQPVQIGPGHSVSCLLYRGTTNNG